MHMSPGRRPRRACTQSMLSVYYERCFDEDIDELRARPMRTLAPPLGTCVAQGGVGGVKTCLYLFKPRARQ